MSSTHAVWRHACAPQPPPCTTFPEKTSFFEDMMLTAGKRDDDNTSPLDTVLRVIAIDAVVKEPQLTCKFSMIKYAVVVSMSTQAGAVEDMLHPEIMYGFEVVPLPPTTPLAAVKPALLVM